MLSLLKAKSVKSPILNTVAKNFHTSVIWPHQKVNDCYVLDLELSNQLFRHS